jgi:hypothetical protein
MVVTYFYAFSDVDVPDYPVFDENNNRTWGPWVGRSGVDDYSEWREWQTLGYWPTECVWHVPGTVAD